MEVRTPLAAGHDTEKAILGENVLRKAIHEHEETNYT
jgi:hypothetical protein